MSQNMPGVALSDVRGLLNDQLEKFAGPDGLRWVRAIKKTLRGENPWDFARAELDWGAVYEKLGLVAEYQALLAAQADILFPAVDTWAAPIIKGVTPNKVIKVFRDLDVTVYLYIEDLDSSVPKNERDPANGSYVVRFARNIEADPELANRSANMLADADIKGITLLERLLLELAYFLSTGEHLDVENVTLCSGSRHSDGDVPYVYWSAGNRRLCVGCYSPGNRSDDLRARAVVSLPAGALAQAG